MKRGLYTAHAVVLNSFDFSESDRILALYTLEYGKLKGIAKGARASKKRFVGNLDVPSHVKIGFHYNEGVELVRVESAALLDAFTSAKSSIEGLWRASYVVELANELTREGNAVAAAYGLLVGFLKLLDNECREAGALVNAAGADALLRFYEIKLLSALGFMPRLDACVSCGSGFDGLGTRLYFSSDRGGALCRRCSASAPATVPLSAGTAAVLLKASALGMDKLDRLKPGADCLDEAERVMEDFIRHQLGKELRTRKFLAKLKNASGAGF